MKKNNQLEKIAKKVLSRMNSSSDNHGIDPITIIIIISIIVNVIRVIQECRKKSNDMMSKDTKANVLQNDIKQIVLKDSWLNRLRLQRIIKKNLSKDQYNAYGKDLQKSLMEVGINLTEDETYTLMEAAND